MPEIAKSAPDIVAIGASAGGLEAIEALLMRLPPDLPAALLIVMHQQPQRISYLPEVLAMTEMRVVVATEGDRLKSGTCYIDLPNLHLTRAELSREQWADSVWPEDVIVRDGVVHFWFAEDEPGEKRQALRVAAETISGVRGVQEHIMRATYYTSESMTPL